MFCGLLCLLGVSVGRKRLVKFYSGRFRVRVIVGVLGRGRFVVFLGLYLDIGICELGGL